MIRLFKTPSFVRKLFPNRVWSFFSLDKVVYLTFDDGPTVELTEWILDELDRFGVKATFFCVGNNAKTLPSLMKGMVDKGHAIGNHTMHHEKGISVSKDVYFDSISECSTYVKSNLFRPPYGRMSLAYDKELIEKYKIIMWSWLSYDYDSNISVDEILERADKSIVSGDILVLHDNVKVTDRLKVLLPNLIELLLKKGFKFEVITSDLKSRN